jgi:hypothetical protein
MRWALEDRRGMLIGALLGLIISAILYAWVNHQPGTLLLEIELLPLYPPQFNA